MHAGKLLLTLPDYERIFRVIFSVYSASEGADAAAKACIFFATAGSEILRISHKLDARLVAGAMAVMVHGESKSANLLGRVTDSGEFVSDEDAFHCWVEAGGYVIDFSAPLFRRSFELMGINLPIPTRMLQKPLATMASSLQEIRLEGDFFLVRNPRLTDWVQARFPTQALATDLLGICTTWYVRPPRRLREPFTIRDNDGNVDLLTQSGPTITGRW